MQVCTGVRALCPIVAGKGLLLLGAFFLASLPPLAHAQPKPPPAKVIVAPVIQREIAAGQSFVGQVLPARRSIVGSAVDGRVVELLVNDGEYVRVEGQGDSRPIGEPIVQLLTETISIEVAAAQANLELREHELAELEAGSRPEEIAQAQAKLEGSKAVMEFTRAKLVRTKALYENSSSATQEEYEQALSDAVNAQQDHLAAQAAYKMAVDGPRVEQIAQARARVSAAREEVRRLQDQQKKYTIRAPFNGYVVSKLTEVGAWVKRGDPVAEVISLDPAEIDVTIPENYIPHVRLGQVVRVHIDALPDATFSGEVARIVPQADVRARTFPVKIRLENPKTEDGHLLKSGMLARVTLAVGKKQQALLVPKDALVLGGPSPVVMAVDTDPQSKQSVARPIPVQLGVADGELIQVIGNLQPDQQIIVIGNERVRPGQPVAIQAG